MAAAQPRIVVQTGATEPERLAARELANWLGQILGRPLETSERLDGESILVGQGPEARRLFPEIDWDKLGDEEIILKSRGKTLLVAGGRPRGTIYAANRLLHRLGVRWWTPWATQVPKRKTLNLGKLDLRERPTFEARDPFWFHAFDRDWARRNNSNSMHARLTDEDGGKIVYQGFVHTFFPLVPPEKHFKDHPEWYSLIGGQRKWEGAQLCTTNPELRDFVVARVREWLRENPKARIVSVSQNDWYGPCECPNCKALDDAEGSHAATVLALANYVGEQIERDYPNVAIDTLAYQYTRKAPKSLRPRPNVIVRLCSIECNFAQPLTHPSNASFAQDIRDWSRLTNRLYVWNYVTDFPNYMLPFPNWYVIGPNERFFAENGVKGLFEQGAYQSFGASMAEMHAWVQSQLLWNPHQDDKALMREFLRGYYGAAADPIERYLRLVSDAAKDTVTGIWTGPDAEFFTLDTVLKAEALWVDAERRVAKNPDLLWRVRLGHLPVRYVILSRWVGLQKEALARDVKWPLPSSRKAVADAWMAVATGPGPKGWSPITHMSEAGLTPARWAERFVQDPPPPTVLARSPSHLPSDIQRELFGKEIDLQDDRARLFGEGSMAELRADPAASDGVACRMPDSHHEWAFQVAVPKEAQTGRWRVYAVVRGEGGASFTAGLWSADEAKSLGSLPATKGSVTYRSHLIGTTELRKNVYIWLAPVDGQGGSIWVDRVILVKEGG